MNLHEFRAYLPTYVRIMPLYIIIMKNVLKER